MVNEDNIKGDVMNSDKFRDRLHLVNFTLRALIIGYFVFWIIQMIMLCIDAYFY